MIRAFVCVGCIVAAVAAAEPVAAQQMAPQQPHITVDGRAQEMVEPDALRIAVGVETHAASHIDAMGENAKVVARVIAAAKQRGIEPADIRTGRLDLRSESGSYATKGQPFRAVNLVSVTVRKVAEADQLVAALITAGANRVHGIAPIIERSAERAGRLREKAIANAREVAEQSVKAAGARLGPILSIRATTEDWAAGQHFAYRAGGGGGGGVPIEEGTVPVTTSINMTWSIIP